jgi:hypothetical protein
MARPSRKSSLLPVRLTSLPRSQNVVPVGSDVPRRKRAHLDQRVPGSRQVVASAEKRHSAEAARLDHSGSLSLNRETSFSVVGPDSGPFGPRNNEPSGE